MRTFLTITLISCLLTTSACRDDNAELAPPKIHYGQAICHMCSMIVSDERFAGAIAIRENGTVEYLLFDDIGEMLTLIPDPTTESRWYVKDASTLKWIEAEEAIYLVNPLLMTPMGFGIAAYASPLTAAQALNEQGGQLMGLPDARTAMKKP